MYSFPNGDRYLGEYKYDIPHGWGVYLFSAGQKYEGQWQSGKKHGWCIYTIDTGEKWAGEWVDGRPKWVQGLSEGENMEKWPHEIVEKVEYAWTACKKAKEVIITTYLFFLPYTIYRLQKKEVTEQMNTGSQKVTFKSPLEKLYLKLLMLLPMPK